jgi:H/ACA ribonucleoprotein complex subunit 3
MMHLLKCPDCKSYGLSEKCSCGGTRAKPKPPKYSPEDKYGDYRRKYKEEHKESPAGEAQ